MIEILLVFALAIGLGWLLGLYLARVMRGDASRLDRGFGPVERGIYRLLGTDDSRGMTWRGYAKAFVMSNVVVGGVVWLLLMTQSWLPLNPDGAPNMRWDTALHTMVSFLTNTNQQHYSGQAQLSFVSHMAGIVGLQVVTPMMGLALVVATLRGLFGGRREMEAQAAGGAAASSPSSSAGPDEARDLGNFWVDVTRACVRFMQPLALVWSLLLTSQGVPSSLQAAPVATPLDAQAGMASQSIPLGPVSPMVAVKQLGTNGGGWYGPNSSVPLENPTPLSNLLETLALILIPVSITFMLGSFTRRRKLTALVFGAMLLATAPLRA